eukprot:jgi/Botrbrau1/8750/Bobra.0090s0024.1
MQVGRAGIGSVAPRGPKAPLPNVQVQKVQRGAEVTQGQVGGSVATSGKGGDRVMQSGTGGGKRRAPAVPGDRPSETVEHKVKRVKQVWQAEVDAAAEAALSRYMRRAFNEPDYVTDSNPVLRKNRLDRPEPPAVIAPTNILTHNLFEYISGTAIPFCGRTASPTGTRSCDRSA